jgi:hypothetical protein
VAAFAQPGAGAECGEKRLGVLPEETLREIEERRFRVTVLDTGMVADFTYARAPSARLFGDAGKPDLHFTAPLSAYLQMVSRQEDPDTLFFNRSLSIEGDTELGLRVKNMLDALEWPQLSWQGLRPTFLKPRSTSATPVRGQAPGGGGTDRPRAPTPVRYRGVQQRQPGRRRGRLTRTGNASQPARALSVCSRSGGNRAEPSPHRRSRNGFCGSMRQPLRWRDVRGWQ